MKRKLTTLHGKRIDEINRADVVKACDTIHKTAPVSANRALAHLKHLMSCCVERGMIEVNPIAGMKPLSKELPRERVLSDAELGALWTACEDEGYSFGDCMKPLILSGQRRAEVAEIRWSELDLEKRLWTLPSQRTKNGRQHTVPITDAMMDVLRRVPKFIRSDCVFTTTGMDGKGRWVDNRMIERLWRSLKYECVYLNAFETGSELRAGICKWLTYYNSERPHSTHVILTPDEAYDSKTQPMRLAA